MQPTHQCIHGAPDAVSNVRTCIEGFCIQLAAIIVLSAMGILVRWAW
jgi:hypothetical protein